MSFFRSMLFSFIVRITRSICWHFDFVLFLFQLNEANFLALLLLLFYFLFCFGCCLLLTQFQLFAKLFYCFYFLFSPFHQKDVLIILSTKPKCQTNLFFFQFFFFFHSFPFLILLCKKKKMSEDFNVSLILDNVVHGVYVNIWNWVNEFVFMKFVLFNSMGIGIRRYDCTHQI